MKRLTILTTSFLLWSCTTPEIPDYKAEILEAERAFAESAQANGVPAAFLEFAGDSVAIKRGGKVLVGRQAVIDAYADFSPTANLSWEPDFIDVSESGDMAYTYGKFQFTDVDNAGAEIMREGYFHTVWKRQNDGSWKYVYD